MFWMLKKIEVAENAKLKLNDEEWPSWEIEEGRTCQMEWRYHYSSTKIDSGSLQDQMEIGMAQFRVKVSKNHVLDEQTRVSKY